MLGTRLFKADGRDVAKINVIGTTAGLIGHNVARSPYRIFELDAEMNVFHALSVNRP